MLLKLRFSKFMQRFLVSFFLIVASSCDSGEKYAGIYSIQGEPSLKYSQTVIELKEGGQGFLQVLDDEVSFRWDLKGNEIRLHTEEGGVIIGNIRGNTFEITLPGTGSVSFKKSQKS